jgi:hypothetical protein
MKIHYYNISTALLIFGLIGGCKPGSVPADTSEAYDIILSKSTIYESRVSNEISVWTPYQIKAELPEYEIKERGHCWSSKSPQPTLADRSAQANDKRRASVLRGISLDSTYYIEPYFILNNGKVVYGRDLKQKTLVFRRKTCDVITEKPALSEIPFPAQINYLGWIISFWTNNETLYALNIVGDCWSYDRTYRQWNLVAKLPFETKKGVWQYLSDFEGFASNGQSYAVLTKILDQSGTVNNVRADSVQLWKLNESKKEWVKLATLVQPTERSSYTYEKSQKLYFIRSYYADPTTVSKLDVYDINTNQWRVSTISLPFPVFYSRQRIENGLYMVRNGVYSSGKGAIVEHNIDTGAERNLELETVCSSPIIQYGGYWLALGDKLWVGGTYLENFNPDNPYKHVFIHGLARWFSPKTNQWSTITYDIADLITLNTLDVDYPQGFGDGKRLYFVSKSRQKIWEWEPK